METPAPTAAEKATQIMLLQHICKKCEETYSNNPLDAENLTMWGQTIIHLSRLQSREIAKKLHEDGIKKLKEAVLRDPDYYQANFYLAHALLLFGFLFADSKEALSLFGEGKKQIQQALHHDPKNEAFLSVLQMASEAPKAYEERQRGGVPPALGVVPPRSSKSSKKKYGILGCVILAAAVGTAAWVGFSKYNVPQPPPRR